jgi:hypothetical protein
VGTIGWTGGFLQGGVAQWVDELTELSNTAWTPAVVRRTELTWR